MISILAFRLGSPCISKFVEMNIDLTIINSQGRNCWGQETPPKAFCEIYTWAQTN